MWSWVLSLDPPIYLEWFISVSMNMTFCVAFLITCQVSVIFFFFYNLSVKTTFVFRQEKKWIKPVRDWSLVGLPVSWAAPGSIWLDLVNSVNQYIVYWSFDTCISIYRLSQHSLFTVIPFKLAYFISGKHPSTLLFIVCEWPLTFTTALGSIPLWLSLVLQNSCASVHLLEL